MKLTKRKALEICKELWTWLAETGTGQKRDWPGWKKYGEMACDCPCCEYALTLRREHQNCNVCPLLNYAWGDKRYKPCLIWSPQDDTFYGLWEHASIFERAYYAAWMVDACDRALADLANKERTSTR